MLNMYVLGHEKMERVQIGKRAQKHTDEMKCVELMR